jgi:hypothetical protein
MNNPFASSWTRAVRNLFSQRRTRQATRPRSAGSRPRLEALEERLAPATVNVTVSELNGTEEEIAHAFTFERDNSNRDFLSAADVRGRKRQRGTASGAA